jgi:mono/diheme cytochrome c family protein
MGEARAGNRCAAAAGSAQRLRRHPPPVRATAAVAALPDGLIPAPPASSGSHVEECMMRMKPLFPLVLLAWGGLAAALAAAPIQQTVEAPLGAENGESLFKTYCASCHGRTAKGDGPISQHLRTAPPDLTLLARRAGGKFDAEKVHRIIDGRKPISGHGGGDMPVWGDAFRRTGQGGGTEEAVRARIEAIVEHLREIQAQQAGGAPPRPVTP